MRIESGKLRTRIRIEENTPTRSPSGQPVASWSLFGEVWAEAVPGGSREQQRAYQMNSEVRQIWRIRGPLAVTANMRVIENGRRFDIVTVETGDGLAPEACREEIRLLCRTGSSEGS